MATPGLGATFGNYRVVQKLGEGGMGVVYLGEHTLLGKRAAIKVLHPELSNDREIINRFFNEARSSTLLHHPGVIEIFDFGHHESGCAYIIMEFLEGESLMARIRREGHLRWDFAAEIARQISGALAAAHARGIVHRDLKPDNVYLVADRDLPFGVRVKVLDFGIAKLTGAESSAGVKTRTGALLGTPAYMSPEQCRGSGAVDYRTDIYALGCVLYEMLSGRPPFVGAGLGEVIAMHLTSAVPPLDVSVPPPLAALVMRALAKKPEERFASMEELTAQLEALSPSRRSGETPVIAPPLTTPAGPASGPTTTLSRAAGQVEPAPKDSGHHHGRQALVGGAALVVAVGAAAGGFLLWGRPGARPRVTEAPIAAPVVAAPAVAVPARPAPVKLRIETEPEGADVYRAADGLGLGKTPLEESVAPSSEVMRFVIKLDKFLDEEVEIPASQDGMRRIVLKRARTLAAKSARAHTEKPTKPAPAVKPRSPDRKVKVDDPFEKKSHIGLDD